MKPLVMADPPMIIAQNKPQSVYCDPVGKSAFFNGGFWRVYFIKKVNFALQKCVLVTFTSCRRLIFFPKYKIFSSK